MFVKLGGWLFRRRTALPLPIAVMLLLLSPATGQADGLFWIGVAVVSTGELLRLWAVRHIGVISRTRSDRLGPLVSTGPFAWVRNPLYLGNLLLWIGFSLSARLLWFLPIVVALLAIEYHAIVRWEEGLLESRLGTVYRAYASRVPRWIPLRRQSAVGSRQSAVGSPPVEVFSWRDTVFSERGTLLAIVAGYLLLWLKTRLIT